MTNAEKYLRDGADVWKLANEIKTYSENTIQLMPFNIEAFFKQPAKPTLTEDERAILRNIRDFENDAQIIKIGNNKAFSGLYISFTYEYKTQNGITGTSHHKEPFRVYNHLFQFIKERRRISNTGTIRR